MEQQRLPTAENIVTCSFGSVVLRPLHAAAELNAFLYRNRNGNCQFLDSLLY